MQSFGTNRGDSNGHRSVAGGYLDRNIQSSHTKGVVSLPTAASVGQQFGGRVNDRPVRLPTGRSGRPETLLVLFLAHPRCSRLFQQLLDCAPRIDERLSDRVQFLNIGDPRWTQPNGDGYIKCEGLNPADLQRDWDEAIEAAGGADASITRQVHEAVKLLLDGEVRMPCLVLQLRQRPLEAPAVIELPEQVDHADGLASQLLECVVAVLAATPLRAQLNNAGSQAEAYSREIIVECRAKLEAAIHKAVGKSGWILPKARLSDTRIKLLRHLARQTERQATPQIRRLWGEGNFQSGDLSALVSLGYIDSVKRIGYLILPKGREALSHYVLRKP